MLWTRLAPDPLGFRGAMAIGPVEVSFEIAADPVMQHVVRKGEATARIEVAHSVYVEVDGLEPARDYSQRNQVPIRSTASRMSAAERA